MPWSDARPSSEMSSTSGILKKEVAEQKVLKHTPMAFEAQSTRVLETYQKAQDTGSDFRMSDIVKEQTGVRRVEEESLDELVQVKLLEKLEEVQATAYQEAYQLGLEEGTQKAFTEMKRQIESGLSEFEALLQKIHHLKTDLFNANERHLVSLSYHMAKLLAQKEVSTDPAQIVNIIKSAVQMAQNEEDVKVYIPAESHAFIQTLMQQQQKDVEFLQKMKVVSREDLKPGDCIVETNYGHVDSTIEQRAQTLWSELQEVMPSGVKS